MSILVLSEHDVREHPAARLHRGHGGVLAALARDELSMPLRFVMRSPATPALMGLCRRTAGRAGLPLKEIVVAWQPGEASTRTRARPPPRRRDGRVAGDPERLAGDRDPHGRCPAVATRTLARPGAGTVAILAPASRPARTSRRCAAC